MEEKEQNLRQFVYGPGLGPGGVHFVMWPHGPGSPYSPLSPCASLKCTQHTCSIALGPPEDTVPGWMV